MKNSVNIANIGEIIFVKSKLAKRISISVRAHSPVRVSVPHNLSFKAAEKFVIEKHDWIVQSKIRVQAREKKFTLFNENTVFRTQSHELVFYPHNTEKVSIAINNGKIVISYPYNVEIEQAIMQDFIRKGITEALKIEAKAYLPERIREIANYHGFNFKKITLRNNKSRWGSCSYDNNINLNIHLMRLPHKLIDYVIIHELCHTVEKNHGKRFWALVENVMPGSKHFDKQLKNYNPHIF